MRKLSIIVLVVAIVVGVCFAVFHKRHHAQLPGQPPAITGIGVVLAMRDGGLEIMGVLPDSPAAKAGLGRGQIIQEIGGTNIAGKPIAECVAMTRGPVGSKVQLEIIDPAKGATNVVEFTREKINLPAAAGATPPVR